MNDLEVGTVARLMARLGVIKEEPPLKNGTRSKYARFPWDEWAKLLKMDPDESFLLYSFDNPNEAGRARGSKLAEAAMPREQGFRLTACVMKDGSGSKLYGVYEPPIRGHERGTHLQRRDDACGARCSGPEGHVCGR